MADDRVPYEQLPCHYRGAPMDMHHGICACGVHIVPGKVRARSVADGVDCPKCLEYVKRYVSG